MIVQKDLSVRKLTENHDVTGTGSALLRSRHGLHEECAGYEGDES